MIEKDMYDDLEAVIIKTTKAKLILIYGCGPRIAYFGSHKANFLYWDQHSVTVGEWKLYGGHRVWITRPNADESVDAYMGDNEPCTIEIRGDEVIATSPMHPIFKIVRGMRVRILNETQFEITNFINNNGEMLYSGGVWSPTCIQPKGKKIVVPIGHEATWDVLKVVIPRRFAGNKVLVNDPQITWTEKEMTVVPQGILTKRCLNTPTGELCCHWEEEGLVFTKTAGYTPYANYPLGGCNVGVFVGENNWMMEMETFGIEQPVIPGATICNTEVWTLSNM